MEENPEYFRVLDPNTPDPPRHTRRNVLIMLGSAAVGLVGGKVLLDNVIAQKIEDAYNKLNPQPQDTFFEGADTGKHYTTIASLLKDVPIVKGQPDWSQFAAPFTLVDCSLAQGPTESPFIFGVKRIIGSGFTPQKGRGIAYSLKDSSSAKIPLPCLVPEMNLEPDPKKSPEYVNLTGLQTLKKDYSQVNLRCSVLPIYASENADTPSGYFVQLDGFSDLNSSTPTP